MSYSENFFNNFFEKYYPSCLRMKDKEITLYQYPNFGDFSDFKSEDLLVPLDERTKPLTKKYDDIALVYPGAFLREREYGKEIDKHEYVMRFNIGTVLGYEKFVGTRCDARVTNTYYFHWKKYQTEEVYQDNIKRTKNFFILSHERMNPFFLEKVLPLNNNIYDNHLIIHHITTMLLKIKNIFNDFTITNSIDIRNNTPTSGFKGLILALALGKKVTIYGLPLFKEQIREYVYYYHEHYDEKTNDYMDTNGHSFSLEKKIISKLIMNNDNIYYKI